MLKLLLGDPNARKLKRYQPIVSDINLLEEEIAPLTDNELRGKQQPSNKYWLTPEALPASARSWMRSCPKLSRWCVKPASEFSGCAISMFSSSAAWCCMKVKSLR